MDKSISQKTIVLTFGVLVVCFVAAFYVVAWQEPSQAPPGGNVPTPLNVSSEAQTKEGNLTINGVLKTLQNMIVNLVTIKGDGSVSPNLNSDKVDDYHAADLMAAGGGDFRSEFPIAPTVGYHVQYDWDKDGKSAVGGDCDETCPACYSGSAAGTQSPDGKDQDCDGLIDESSPAISKRCDLPNDGILKSGLTSACSNYCASLDRAYVSMTGCYDYPDHSYDAFNFTTCGAQGSYNYHRGAGCHADYDVTCNCGPTYQ